MLQLLFLSLLFFSAVYAIDNLTVAFQWKMLDFDYPTNEARHDAVRSEEFIPENNLPLGLEVYGDRLFITIPRWKAGVAASLAYIHLSDPMDSPKLHPYPNWSSHQLRPGQDSPPQIVSPFRIRADSCGRLWILDTGIANLIDVNVTQISKPRLLIYDLSNDQLIRSFTIPDKQLHKENSFFANIAVEENECDNSFAYLADLGHPALVVYSFKEDKSWLVKHHYFNIDPQAGDMNVAGISFQWTDGIFGLALSNNDSEGFSTLYFHPMTSFNEFTVSTKVLRNETLATNSKENFHEFKILGSRGPRAESGASFFHKKTNVLFYALVNLNAVACWRTTNPTYTMESQGRVFMSNETMVFPNDIKVDANDILWVLSDKLPIYMYKVLDYTEYNFRILNSTVANAIRGTACDSKMVVNPNIVRTIVDKTRASIAKGGSQNVGIHICAMFITLFAIFLR